MLFLHEHPPMGWFVTAGLVYKSNKGESGNQRVEDQLSIFTTPDFDNIGEHIRVFVLSRADGHFHPGDGDLVLFAFGGEDGGWSIVWGDDQLETIGVHRFEELRVALNIYIFCMDPAALGFVFHQYPIIPRLANQRDVCAFFEGEEI